MKKSFRKYMTKYMSIENWIAFLKRQPEHMKHVYALTLAGSVTALIAFVILYVDYGFWHERYTSEDSLSVVKAATPESESPGKMLSEFFVEAKTRLHEVNTTGRNMLDGKEEYTRDSQ
jgi:hypothetical protein